MTDCIFCQILQNRGQARFVFENDLVAAFLDARPVFFGHTLVIPRAHYETLPDLPTDMLVPLFSAAQIVARAMEHGLGAEGSLVLMNNRVSQSVPHLHVHVIPRSRGDGLRGFLWPRQRYPDEATEMRIAEMLRAAIAEIGRGQAMVGVQARASRGTFSPPSQQDSSL